MTPEATNAMSILIAAIGLLLVIMAVVFIASARKNKKTEVSAPPPPPVPLPEEKPRERVSVEVPAPAAVEAKVPEQDLLAPSRTLKEALAPTEKNLFGRLRNLFKSENEQKNFDEIEEVLYTSDLGPQTVERLMEAVRSQLSRSERSNIENIKSALKSEFEDIFSKASIQEPIPDKPLGYLNLSGKPSVLMVVGVNGAGKTTSIGKLAAHLAITGQKVLVAAGDTFRAAAGNQLKTWTDRAQVEIFSPPGVSDPSAVAFDAVAKAKAQNYDVVIVDTAGRLHTQANLMEELKKMKRVMGKALEGAPHEVLIVLDANSGQNALIQARQFHEALTLSGVVLTKMDGTAKGGVAVGLANELQIPIRFIGVGEKIGDLRPFSAKEFVDSIL
jgi:fused signal recognition particle receptor